MEIKTDPRKLNAAFILGLLLWALSFLVYLEKDGTGKLIWTTFLIITGMIFIAVGLLIKSKFKLTNEYLELSSISGLLRKKILLKEIKKVRFKAKDLPAHVNNPLMLILWDKKFKRTNLLELYNEKGQIAKIDGHLIDDKDFEKLKRKLK